MLHNYVLLLFDLIKNERIDAFRNYHIILIICKIHAKPVKFF